MSRVKICSMWVQMSQARFMIQSNRKGQTKRIMLTLQAQKKLSKTHRLRISSQSTAFKPLLVGIANSSYSKTKHFSIDKIITVVSMCSPSKAKTKCMESINTSHMVQPAKLLNKELTKNKCFTQPKQLKS